MIIGFTSFGNSGLAFVATLRSAFNNSIWLFSFGSCFNSGKSGLRKMFLRLLRSAVLKRQRYFTRRPRNDEDPAGQSEFFQIPGVFVIVRLANSDVINFLDD